MNDELGLWLHFDEYSIEVAALLLAGIDPYTVDCKLSNAKTNQNPKASKALLYQNLLEQEICSENSRIKKINSLPEPDGYDEYYMGAFSVHNQITISKEDIQNWARSKGFEFPYGCPIEPDKQQSPRETPLDDLFNKDNPYLSKKLEAVISVWLELVENGTSKRTPKIAATEILKKRYPDIKGVDKLAQIIGWTPEGGSEHFPTTGRLLTSIRDKK